MTTKLSRIAWFLLAATVVPATALGGFKTSEEVTITNVTNGVRMRGSLVGAHNSGDNLQYIGCQIRYDFAYCWARDAAGRTAMCSTSSPGHMAAMRSVNAASYLDVTIQAGACTTLEISTSSRWMSPVRNWTVQP